MNTYHRLQTNYDSRLTRRREINFVSIQKTLCTLFINHLTASPKGRFAPFSSRLRTFLSPNYNKHTCGSSKDDTSHTPNPRTQAKELISHTDDTNVSPEPTGPSHLSVGLIFALCDKTQDVSVPA